MPSLPSLVQPPTACPALLLWASAVISICYNITFYSSFMSYGKASHFTITCSLVCIYCTFTFISVVVDCTHFLGIRQGSSGSSSVFSLFCPLFSALFSQHLTPSPHLYSDPHQCTGSLLQDHSYNSCWRTCSRVLY